MKNEDTSITIARINARQAIIGAVIVGAVSIITTLIATGNLLAKAPIGTSANATGGEAAGNVLNAPHLAFSSKKMDLSLDQCMHNAREALGNAQDAKGNRYTGGDSKRYIAWAYNGDTIGLIWCHIDEGMVIYIGSGKDWVKADKTAENLRRLFRTAK